MVWLSGNIILECPFCGKETIEAFRRPARTITKTSRISAGAKTKNYRLEEDYDIRSGCSACGKSKKEVAEAFETGITKEISHEERLKRLRDSGLPLRVETKRR